jgi:hypothetical protein
MDSLAVYPHVEPDTPMYRSLNLILETFHQDFEWKTLID